jgi:hypothetical protein
MTSVPGALIALSLVVLSAACGGPAIPREQAFPRLKAAIEGAVSTPEQSQENSRLVETIIEDDHLMGMFRHEVEEAIGQGEPCSRHPRCAENDFSGDDWFYTVGTMGEGATGALPILIVGFDTSGRVVKVWNLRTH